MAVLADKKKILIVAISAVIVLAPACDSQGRSKIDYSSSSQEDRESLKRAAAELGYSPRETRDANGNSVVSMDGVHRDDAKKWRLSL
jgi:hypothetical protein